jgi:hypothetical protein
MLRPALMLAATGTVSCFGCRSIGRFPGIDPTDYAYAYFNGTASQVYPYSVPRLESSAVQALADLGFTNIERTPDGEAVKIHAKTLDHRHAWIKIRPRNTMSFMSVHIGLERDEEVSLALFQRVALNFGAVPRTIIPLEPTLARRQDPLLMPRTPLEPLIPSAPVFEELITPEPAPSSAVSPFAPTEGPPVRP